MIETAILTIRGERFFYSAAHLLGEKPEAHRVPQSLSGRTETTAHADPLPAAVETTRSVGAVTHASGAARSFDNLLHSTGDVTVTARQSTASKPVFSASAVLAAIASELSIIKHEDGLTDADLGRVLGKSEDQAAKYRTGLAEMGVVAFAAAKREWNGRFTGAVDRLCVESRPVSASDRTAQCSVLKAALAMSEALEGDDEIVREEVRKNRATLEAARDAIGAQLEKLRPAA